MSEKPQQTGKNKRGKYRSVGYYSHQGKEIVGLKRRPDGRFYASSNPNKKFGKDPSKAVHAFYVWKAQQSDSLIEPPEGSDVLAYVEDDFGTEQPTTQLHKEYWTAYFRNLILTNPRQAAIELDVPHLADKPVMASAAKLTLEELGDKYHKERRNKQGELLEPKHVRQSKKWWQQFLDIVEVKTVKELTPDKINKYNDAIMSEFDGGKEPTYVKLRFGKVKTIFNFAIDKGIDPAEYRRVLDLCRVLEIPAPNPANPNPITPDDFSALLEKADVRQRAILLCGLNFCMHSGEVAELQKSDINLKAKTLVGVRPKNRKTRIGIVWTRTAEAIENYLKAKPHNAPHLFNSRIGTPLTSKAVGRLVISLRRKAGLPETVSFDTIRDGAYTAAIEGGADLLHAKLLAGHAVGMTDQYVRRNPKMVADACEAIEKLYFPPEKKQPKPTKPKTK